MPKCIWRGEWFVYHFKKREFIRTYARAGNRRPEAPESIIAVWTPSVRRAKGYKNPSAAQKAAARINAGAAGPVPPVSVVTGEAARCLEVLNRRPAAVCAR